jgi:hypothetical protein
MSKIYGMLAASSLLALTMIGPVAVAADNSTSEQPTTTTTDSNGKTSDRTPGDPSPDRTPNASSSGATGTDAGQTTNGTSDRTPDNKDQK